MRDHRIVKLRFLFATLYCAILVWFFPGLNLCIWWIPLGLFMPVITLSGCSVCNTGTQSFSVQMDITGVTNGVSCTTCAALNTSWTIDIFGSGCRYLRLGVHANCGGSESLEFVWGNPVNTATIMFTPGFPTADALYYEGAGGSGQDCSASPASLSLVSDTSGLCDGGSVTVTPL